MKPKVSVCIPAYLQGNLLLRTLDSVFMQNYRDYEIIITDDSPDDSVEKVVHKFASSSNLIYRRNPVRKGSPANWNEAVALANGEYIKILHHDDWFAGEDSLGRFVQALDENEDSDFVFSSAIVDDHCSQSTHLHAPTDEQLRALCNGPIVLFLGNFVGAPSATMFRKQSFNGFDTNLKWVVDIDFYIQLLFRNSRYVHIPAPLVCTTAGAPHQITSECVEDKKLQMFEWLYLYCKTREKCHASYPMFRSIKDLVVRFDVTSVEEFGLAGSPYQVPMSVKALVLLQKLKGYLH